MTHNESPWVNLALKYAIGAPTLCLIVSGSILISAVFSIRSYLSSLGEDGADINLKTLIIYSLAFGLFLVGYVLDSAFSINFWMHFDKQTNYEKQAKEYYIAELISLTFTFVSQCLLCVIFWKMNEKEESEQAPSEESEIYSEPLAQSWDEDASL